MGNVFEICALMMYVESILTKRMNKFLIISIWSLLFISDEILVGNNIPAILKLILYIAIIFGSVCAFFKGSLKRKSIIVAFSMGFQIISECLTGIIIGNINIESTSELFYSIGYIVSKIIFLVLIRIFLHFNYRRSKYDINIKSLISIIVVPILSVALIEIFYGFNVHNEHISIQDLFFYLIVLSINFIAVIQYDDVQYMVYLDNENRSLENQKKYYIRQYETTKKLWDEIRQLRHNMKNEYISHNILLQNKQYDELLNVYSKKIGELDNTTVISKSGNIYVDAIINYKVSEIISLGGKFDCKIIVPEKLDIESDDILLILGNALDNVIGAFSEPNEFERDGSFFIVYEKSSLYIEITNSYYGNRNRKSDNNYLTTKRDKEFHGLGLKAIKSVAEKYNGSVNITEKDNKFTFSVILYV